MGYFEKFISGDLTEVLENFMKFFSDNEFPYNFLNILEEMFGKDNIRGFNPNSFYEIENWKGYLIEHKTILLKITNMEKYLKLTLRKKSLLVSATCFSTREEEIYKFHKNTSDGNFRAYVFDLIACGTMDFEDTVYFKNSLKNRKKFNKKLFKKNYKDDLNINVDVEKILTAGNINVYLLKTPSGNILFDSNGTIIKYENINKNVLEYTYDYIEQLKDLGVKL